MSKAGYALRRRIALTIFCEFVKQRASFSDIAARLGCPESDLRRWMKPQCITLDRASDMLFAISSAELKWGVTAPSEAGDMRGKDTE